MLVAERPYSFSYIYCLRYLSCRKVIVKLTFWLAIKKTCVRLRYANRTYRTSQKRTNQQMLTSHAENLVAISP